MTYEIIRENLYQHGLLNSYMYVIKKQTFRTLIEVMLTLYCLLETYYDVMNQQVRD